MHVRRGLAAAAAGTLLALTGTVAVSAPAVAAAPSATLTIQSTSSSPDFFVVLVNVDADVPAGAPIGFVLRGDDPVFDDDLGVNVTGTQTFTGPVSLFAIVPRTTLDEDRPGQDELYARFSAPGLKLTTNVVTGFF